MKSDVIKPLADRTLAALERVERWLTCAGFFVLIAVIFLDVLSREVTGTGLQWAPQAGVYANVIVVMFGLGLASSGGAHLRPRFADGWTPARWGPALDRLNDLGMAAFCGVFAAVAVGVVAESVALGDRSVSLRIAVWPFQAAVPLAFTLTGIRHLAYAMWPDLRPADASALAPGAADEY